MTEPTELDLWGSDNNTNIEVEPENQPEEDDNFVETFNQTIEEPEDDPFMSALYKNKDIIEADEDLGIEIEEEKPVIEKTERPKPKRQETLSGNNPFRKGSIGDEDVISDTKRSSLKASLTSDTDALTTEEIEKAENNDDADENPFMAVLKSMGVTDLEDDEIVQSGSFDPLTTIYPDDDDVGEVNKELDRNENQVEEEEDDDEEEELTNLNMLHIEERGDIHDDGGTSHSSDSEEDNTNFGVFKIRTPVKILDRDQVNMEQIMTQPIQLSQNNQLPQQPIPHKGPRERKVQEGTKPWKDKQTRVMEEQEEVDRMFNDLRSDQPTECENLPPAVSDENTFLRIDDDKPIRFESPLSDKFAGEEVEWEALPKSISAVADETDIWGETDVKFDVEFEPLPGEVVEFEPYNPVTENFEWKMLIRQPEKKSKAKQISRYTTNRWWKEVYIRLGDDKDRPCLRLFDNLEDDQPYRTIRLEPYMQLSRDKMQQYDKYGKLHIFKINHVMYKETVGMRTEKFSLKTLQNLVSHKPKMNMVLDHMPVRTEMVKFGSLDQKPLRALMVAIVDSMMSIASHRDASLEYTKEEVCCYVNDEYECQLSDSGSIIAHKARTRVFFAAFVTGQPYIVLGINDKWRYGNEVVSRKDIIPIMHDDWINIYEPEFHSCVNMEEYAKDHMIKFYPLDGCKFELMRFRTPLRQNKELPLIVSTNFKIQGVRVIIRIDLSVPGFFSASKRHGAVHCDDIEIRIPIPEEWAYHFRVEKHHKYGSVHSALRKPGKIKGFDRITQLAQSLLPPSLLEASSGIAKYEHLYRAIVWRIPRLPDKHEASYKPHMMTCKLILAPQDTVPTLEQLVKTFDVEFTMSASTVSGATVRSISVEHTITPERFVKYLASFKYQRDIEYDYGTPKPPVIKSILDDDPEPSESYKAPPFEQNEHSSTQHSSEVESNEPDLFNDSSNLNYSNTKSNPTVTHSAFDDLMNLDFNQPIITNTETGDAISGNIVVDDIEMVDD